MASKQNEILKITNEMSLYLKFLHQEGNIICKELLRRYSQYAVRSIYRHAKKEISVKMPIDVRKTNKGRPPKMTKHDERLLLRTIKRLRNANTSFNVQILQNEAGLKHISTRTVNRYPNKHKYKYLQSRKMGILTAKDKKKRLHFARKVMRLIPENFWRDGVQFYFDGVSFAYKTNPFNDASATKTMTWRRPNEGLLCTTKRKKEGNGCPMEHFFVAIAYNKGFILCKQHHGTLTADGFAEFVRSYFP